METLVNLLPKQPINGQFQIMWLVLVSSDPGCYKSFPHGKKHTYDNKPLLAHIFQA